jgi:hypothetical protein
MASRFSGANVHVYVLCISKEEHLLYLLQLLPAYYQILALDLMFSIHFHVLNPFSQRDNFKEKVKKQLCAGLNAPSDGVQVIILLTHLSFIFHGMTNIILCLICNPSILVP